METRIYEHGMEVGTEISNEAQSSIKITRNAKGEMTYEVKVYDDNPDTIKAKLDAYLEIAKARVV